jgi:AbrB family looped-hinge helix DNA binding protein
MSRPVTRGGTAEPRARVGYVDNDPVVLSYARARHRDPDTQRVVVCMIGITYQEAAMRLNSKGQVTIPAELRERHGLHEGDEVDVIEDGSALRIIQVKGAPTRGQRLVRRMRGRASTSMSTDQLMELLRGD